MASSYVKGYARLSCFSLTLLLSCQSWRGETDFIRLRLGLAEVFAAFCISDEWEGIEVEICGRSSWLQARSGRELLVAIARPDRDGTQAECSRFYACHRFRRV